MGKRLISADTARAVDGTSVTDSYANLGAALTKVWVQMSIKNSTDVTVFISEDGTNNHYEMPAGSQESFDLQTNSPDDAISGKAVGTQFRVKANTGSLPSSGRVIIQGQYL